MDDTIGGEGEFIWPARTFRNWVSDGSSGFKAEQGRYHLYVSLACPFAHQTLILRKLKGLEDVISTTVVDWFVTEKGWSFTDKKPKCTLDTINGCELLHQVYLKSDPDFKGMSDVPVMWDKQRNMIVSNDPSEIMLMLNSEFNAFTKDGSNRDLDLYPENLRDQIDALNKWIDPHINIGVYKCGFARSQGAYDRAVKDLFEHLDKVELILSQRRYLTGPAITEADIRLFCTFVRFDWVYHGHFKCNKRKLIEYPNIWGYTRDIYQMGNIGETVDREHIVKYYYWYEIATMGQRKGTFLGTSHETINPQRIVAAGPDLDFNEPHGRESVGQSNK